MRPGTRVRAAFRPPTMVGTVLAVDDPIAWKNTMRFMGQLPTQAEATAHVEDLRRRGLSLRVPVRWDTGAIMFEEPADLIQEPDAVQLRPAAVALAVADALDAVSWHSTAEGLRLRAKHSDAEAAVALSALTDKAKSFLSPELRAHVERL